MDWLTFLLGILVGVSGAFLLNALRMKRFDLSDELLNLNAVAHHWGNLGFWDNSQNYATACEQLALKVGDTAKLNSTSEIMDVGFGTGDQLKLWHDKYEVQHISGVNASPSQVGLAQHKLRTHGVQAFLHNYDHSAINSHPDRSFSHVVSIDAAYFFKDRDQWFKQAHRILKPEGKLVVTDMLMPHQPTDLLQEFLMRVALWLCGIPKDNVVTAEDYQQQLVNAGFIDTQLEDISRQVMDGFSQWLPEYKKQFPGLSSAPIWHKYTGTVWILKWLRKHDLLRYYLVSAQR